MNRIDKELKNIISNKYAFDEVTNQRLLEVLYLANDLLIKHGLFDTEIVFRNHQDAFGKCINSGERISIQLRYAINDDMSEIENTILHEIAHALVGNEYGHNIVWQEKAKEIGVTIYRNYRK